MKKFLIIFTSLLFLAINAQATIRYVTQNGARTQDGSSWANASSDLQAVINASDWSGDTIFVAAGTYKPIRKANEYATNNISPNDRTNAFVIVKSISIFGSFAGTETSPDERQLPASGDYTSILSGDFLGNDGPNFSGMSENAYHVLLMFENNTTRDLFIDGFTIRGGNANGGNDPMLDVTIINNAFWFEHNVGGGMFLYAAVPVLTNIKITGNSAAISGGGIYCKNAASPVLNNVIISGNRAAGISGNSGSGGGMFYGNGNPVLNNVIVSGNSAGYGGGISNGYGLGVFNNVIISGNTASIMGGGMGNSSSAPVMSNMIIRENTAPQGGGICNIGNHNWGYKSVMTNILISGNTASTDGGGIYNGNSSPILTNVTISGNTASAGGGIYNSSYSETQFSAPEIRNSIIWGNSSDNVFVFNSDFSAPVYSYSLIEGEALTNGIILNCDPLFDSNFNLQEGSPAINAGNNLFFASGQTPDLSAITTDLNGNPRIIAAIDLGAYEWQYGIAAHDILQILTCYPSTILDVFANDIMIPCNRTEIELTITGGSKIGATTSVDSDKNIVYTYPAGFTGRDTLEYAVTCRDVVYTANVFITVVKCPDNIDEAECFGEPASTEWSIKELDRSSVNIHMYAQPLVGDFDGCGKNEVIVFNNIGSPQFSDALLIFDDQLQLKASISIPTTYCYLAYPISIADVDGDGKAEIFVLTGNTATRTLRCYYYNGTNWVAKPGFATSNITVPYTSNGIQGMPTIVIGDINGDGIPELFVYDRIINSRTGTVIATLPTGSRGGYNAYNNGSYAYFPVLADVDNDGILEIVTGNMVYKAQINEGSTTGTVTLAYQAPAGVDVKDGFTSVADIDLDGYLDVIVTHNDNHVSKAYVWSPYKGTLLGQTLAGNSAGSTVSRGNISRAFIGDVNNDGYPEIAYSYHLGMTCYRYNPVTNNFVELWRRSTTDESGFTAMSMFDFNQDGKQEIIYRDETHLRIIDGETGLNKESIPCFSATASEMPIVVDFSGKGNAEILVSGALLNNTYAPVYIRRYVSSIPGAWAPARKVWNQYGYNAVNINEDLTVPRYQMNPATVFPNGKRPYNAFLQQQTLLNTSGDTYWSMPNIVFVNTPEAISTCDSIVFTGCITNTGDAALQAPFYVTFYKNDTIATNIIAMDSIKKNLNVDSTLCFEFTINNISDYAPFTSIWISINDHNGDYPYQAQCKVDGRREIPVKSCELAEFYVNEIHHSELPEITFCENEMYFLTEVEDWVTLEWWINGVEEVPARDRTVWNGVFPNGTYEIEMRVFFENVESVSVLSTLNVFKAWIKMRNVKKE